MITARAIADYIRAANPGAALSGATSAHAVKVVPDSDDATGNLPQAPDRAVLVRILTGSAPIRERTFDRPNVQVMCRGLQGSIPDAEALASRVDDILMGIVPPVLMSGFRIVLIDQLGGPPAWLSIDDGRRSTLAANYALQVARSVH